MSDKCKRCGACKECGAIRPVSYPVYPVYPYQPYPNYVPSWQPGRWNQVSGTSASPITNPTPQNFC